MSVDNAHSNVGNFSGGRHAPATVRGPACSLHLRSSGRQTRSARRGLSAFARDERGGISIFLLVLFIMLLVVGGMAVDYQRHEAARADLQDALDRGSLAAANLNQAYVVNGTKTTDEQAWDVINEFMASRNFKQDQFSLTAAVADVSGGRQVTAQAQIQIQTIFLSLIGIDTLDVNATSVATHAASKLEIMLVLDITGSMTWNLSSGGTKIAKLRTAAKDFIDTVLADGADAYTAVSIIPFSQHVALPTVMTDLYNINSHHNYSTCIDYSEYDFTTRTMPLSPTTPYEQSQHFREPIGSNTRNCPKANNAITPYSNDATTLKNAIDAMTTETWTAMYMGMKWATSLLDPESAPIVDALIANGDLPATFSGYPSAWDDMSTRKIIILMSDGANTELRRMDTTTYAGQTPDYWETNSPPGGSVIKIIDNQDRGDGDPLLADICAVAQTGGNTVVYSIAFEVQDDLVAQAALSNCASSSGTYYLVEDDDLVTAFQNIADEITNLKLTN